VTNIDCRLEKKIRSTTKRFSSLSVSEGEQLC
jgi:hypothetical protein